MAKINIFQKGLHPNSAGCKGHIAPGDEFELDGLRRCGWFEFPDCEKLLAIANWHLKDWNEELITPDKELAMSPVVVRDELLYALKHFQLAHLPFTMRFAEFVADKSPFATEIVRKTLAVESI